MPAAQFVPPVMLTPLPPPAVSVGAVHAYPWPNAVDAYPIVRKTATAGRNFFIFIPPEMALAGIRLASECCRGLWLGKEPAAHFFML